MDYENGEVDGEGEAGYNNSHRAFLQAFLARSVLTVDEIKPIFAAVQTAHGRPTLTGDITEPEITNAIHTLNSRLSLLDLEIRSTRSQHQDRTLVFALVNTTSDPLTQAATTRTPEEIAFVKRVLDAMFEENNTPNREVMAVQRNRALQLARVREQRQSHVNEHDDEEENGTATQTQTIGITIPQAEKVLRDFVSEGWFEKSRAQYYSLAPRALMELRSWLKEVYNDPADDESGEEAVVRIRDCEGCREIVTVGQRCGNRGCGVRLHEHCTQLFFRGQRSGERKCPKCKQEWTGSDFVGEKAVAGAGRRGTGRVESEEVDDEDE
ncbi:hypothetical protein GQ43DRAFT_453398 [Delitschia confertaspora ATCC 74209]|uniref:Non-structural maintenance of chromosomes element 1 homolog n=1 Tax=Delitschia confertaspora ATCC 74209 TaxID=1513339 RepID=A0A9P4JYS0_9PLEO|nr:hypothetical protein GQ43DRAFT_453398 [Delitschia confertaspora ATCC 74209]